MQGNYPHRIGLGNDSPENTIGKFGHLAQAMLKFGIEFIVLNNVRLGYYPLDPRHWDLSLYHSPKSVPRKLEIAHRILLGMRSNAELSDGRCQSNPAPP
jgi:hypothetical protein